MVNITKSIVLFPKKSVSQKLVNVKDYCKKVFAEGNSRNIYIHNIYINKTCDKTSYTRTLTKSLKVIK